MSDTCVIKHDFSRKRNIENCQLAILSRGVLNNWVLDLPLSKIFAILDWEGSDSFRGCKIIRPTLHTRGVFREIVIGDQAKNWAMPPENQA